MGAPADLETLRVDRVERCDDARLSSGPSDSPLVTPLSMPGGDQCNSQTHGPGTICIRKSSGKITASWNYRGGGAVTGFLRIYQANPLATGCPATATWHTGPSQAWNTGETRSTSKTQTQSGGYTTLIWKYQGAGTYSDWGRTCAVL